MEVPLFGNHYTGTVIYLPSGADTTRVYGSALLYHLVLSSHTQNNCSKYYKNSIRLRPVLV